MSWKNIFEILFSILWEIVVRKMNTKKKIINKINQLLCGPSTSKYLIERNLLREKKLIIKNIIDDISKIDENWYSENFILILILEK